MNSILLQTIPPLLLSLSLFLSSSSGPHMVSAHTRHSTSVDKRMKPPDEGFVHEALWTACFFPCTIRWPLSPSGQNVPCGTPTLRRESLWEQGPWGQGNGNIVLRYLKGCWCLIVVEGRVGGAKTDVCSPPALPLTSSLISRTALTPKFLYLAKGTNLFTGCREMRWKEQWKSGEPSAWCIVGAHSSGVGLEKCPRDTSS